MVGSSRLAASSLKGAGAAAGGFYECSRGQSPGVSHARSPSSVIRPLSLGRFTRLSRAESNRSTNWGKLGDYRLRALVSESFGESCSTSEEGVGASDSIGVGDGVGPVEFGVAVGAAVGAELTSAEQRRLDRKRRREKERAAYQIAAIASSIGFTALAAAAVYHRFAWQTAGGSPPVLEMLGTFTLAVGALVGMEFWARWAHRALWHDSLWNLHESHHRPREGPFEANDIFAIINAVPAIALLAYGFFSPGLVPGLCFGAGLGITMFGMAYMFVHDGLVHKRFPVGPLADVPYFQRVAAAHQLHHAEKFDGVPWGLFLGPEELDSVNGREDLEALLKSRQQQP